MYSFWFTFFPVIFFGIFDTVENPVVLKEFPALYIDGKNKKNNIFWSFSILSLFEGVVHSVVIFYFTIHVVGDGIAASGKTNSLGMVSLVAYYAIVLVVNFKVIYLVFY